MIASERVQATKTKFSGTSEFTRVSRTLSSACAGGYYRIIYEWLWLSVVQEPIKQTNILREPEHKRKKV